MDSPHYTRVDLLYPNKQYYAIQPSAFFFANTNFLCEKSEINSFLSAAYRCNLVLIEFQLCL